MKHWQTLNKHEDIKREYKKKFFVQTLFVIPNLVCFLLPPFVLLIFVLHIYKVFLF